MAPRNAWAVIPAAGRATRMGDRTAERPKPLLRVGPGDGESSTLLGRILSDAGRVAERACIVVGPGDDRIHRALGDRFAGVELHYVVQEERRGVGHAVCRAGEVVDGPFAVIMADAYYHEAVAPHLAAWRDSGISGAVLVEEIGDGTGDPMGLVRVEGSGVREIRKSADATGSTHRVSGLFMLPEEALEVCPELQPSDTGEIEVEAIVRALLARGVRFAALPYRGFRRNVNTPGDLREVRLRARGE